MLAENLNRLGPFRIVAIMAIAAGLVAFFVFIFSRLTEPDFDLLYGDLAISDSSGIVTKLESLGVPYEIRANGAQILVPRDRVSRLRMAMAEEGLPTGGSVGYELFDKSGSLGTTTFVQNINQLRALEGELARTIRSLASVETARVHLVIPRRQLFGRAKEEPSASIFLKVKGAGGFTSSQVQSVRQLVAAAVPGLKPSRVSVVDGKGNLLARAAQAGDEDLAGMGADQMRRSYEHDLSRTIERLLERSVGIGRARAVVTAEMDFDRISLNSELYDPDGQVVRSTQTVEESADTTEREDENAISVGANLPESGLGPAAGAATTASRSLRTEETVNYEISKTVKTHVRESGTVKRLSVAVLVDGTYTTAEDGTKTYVARSDEEMQQLEKLVRSTVGYDEARGDTLDLVNMPFATVEEPQVEEIEEPLLGLSKNDYFRIAEMLVLGFVSLLVILLVVRPMMSRLFEAPPPPRKGTGSEMLTDQSGGGAPALAAPVGAAHAAAAASMPAEVDPGIDMHQVEGRVRASSLKKVGEIIEKHPEETVSIVRNWMFAQR
ncbi:MAG: flagellar basal-body MS-ring/collar protein FliF [Alphaproteobacteria bacterium]